MKRSIAAALTLACLLPIATFASSIDSKIEAQRQKQHDIQARLHEKKTQLESARGKVSTLADQLAQTNRNIDGVRGSIAALQMQLRSNRKRLDWNAVQLGAARATLGRHTAALNRRLVDAYEQGELGYLSVMLSATSFSDFVERWEDIRLLVAVNQRSLRERRVVEASVATAERRLVGDRLRIEQTQADVKAREQQLGALAEQRRGLVAVAEHERNNVAQQVVELEEISQAADNAIAELIRAKQREIAERREAARRAALLAGGDAPPPTAGAPGVLAWPATGPITSPFGMRMHPILGRMIMHNGLDIGASMGSTVTAPADGTIISAGWNDGGYGNMIIIAHGGDMSTLYGHLSQIFVGSNQEIKRGQAIGAVGSTGQSNGPHLHFEVRVNGNVVDPMTYLR